MKRLYVVRHAKRNKNPEDHYKDPGKGLPGVHFDEQPKIDEWVKYLAEHEKGNTLGFFSSIESPAYDAAKSISDKLKRVSIEKELGIEIGVPEGTFTHEPYGGSVFREDPVVCLELCEQYHGFDTFYINGNDIVTMFPFFLKYMRDEINPRLVKEEIDQKEGFRMFYRKIHDYCSMDEGTIEERQKKFQQIVEPIMNTGLDTVVLFTHSGIFSSVLSRFLKEVTIEEGKDVGPESYLGGTVIDYEQKSIRRMQPKQIWSMDHGPLRNQEISYH